MSKRRNDAGVFKKPALPTRLSAATPSKQLLDYVFSAGYDECKKRYENIKPILLQKIPNQLDVPRFVWAEAKCGNLDAFFRLYIIMSLGIFEVHALVDSPEAAQRSAYIHLLIGRSLGSTRCNEEYNRLSPELRPEKKYSDSDNFQREVQIRCDEIIKAIWQHLLSSSGQKREEIGSNLVAIYEYKSKDPHCPESCILKIVAELLLTARAPIPIAIPVSLLLENIISTIWENAKKKETFSKEKYFYHLSVIYDKVVANKQAVSDLFKLIALNCIGYDKCEQKITQLKKSEPIQYDILECEQKITQLKKSEPIQYDILTCISTEFLSVCSAAKPSSLVEDTIKLAVQLVLPKYFDSIYKVTFIGMFKAYLSTTTVDEVIGIVDNMWNVVKIGWGCDAQTFYTLSVIYKLIKNQTVISDLFVLITSQLSQHNQNLQHVTKKVEEFTPHYKGMLEVVANYFITKYQGIELRNILEESYPDSLDNSVYYSLIDGFIKYTTQNPCQDGELFMRCDIKKANNTLAAQITKVPDVLYHLSKIHGKIYGEDEKILLIMIGNLLGSSLGQEEYQGVEEEKFNKLKSIAVNLEPKFSKSDGMTSEGLHKVLKIALDIANNSLVTDTDNNNATSNCTNTPNLGQLLNDEPIAKKLRTQPHYSASNEVVVQELQDDVLNSAINTNNDYAPRSDNQSTADPVIAMSGEYEAMSDEYYNFLDYFQWQQ